MEEMKMKRLLATAAVLAVIVLPCIAAQSGAKSAGGREAAVAEKWIAAWNSHDPDKMLAAFTSDVFYEDVAFGEVSHGSAEFRRFAADEFAAVPDLKVELVRAAVSNGHGTIEWTFSGTDKDIYKTGKKFSVRGVSVIEVRDGKIARSLDYYDAATIMRQVGVLPKQ
jgi:steroid delta-isomerase-like uncharacterized protein